jgi:hypothetical protein
MIFIVHQLLFLLLFVCISVVCHRSSSHKIKSFARVIDNTGRSLASESQQRASKLLAFWNSHKHDATEILSSMPKMSVWQRKRQSAVELQLSPNILDETSDTVVVSWNASSIKFTTGDVMALYCPPEFQPNGEAALTALDIVSINNAQTTQLTFEKLINMRCEYQFLYLTLDGPTWRHTMMVNHHGDTGFFCQIPFSFKKNNTINSILSLLNHQNYHLKKD